MSYRFDRLRVLVVDDNQHMRTLVTAVLNAYGVDTVFEARNAEQAWKILAENPCDIVFLDWAMTGLTGLEFTQKVRTAPDSTNRFVPIIMLSGHTSVDCFNAARDAGANEFLTKPVSPQTILARLVSVIEHPRPFVRTKHYFGPCRRQRVIPYCDPDRRIRETDLLFAAPRKHVERESNEPPANAARSPRGDLHVKAAD